MNAPRPKSKSAKPVSIEKLLSPLCGVARVAWKFVLPGAISAYAEGDHVCASPLLSNWLRLLNRKAGTVGGGNSPEESLADRENITRIHRPKDSPPNRTASLMDWKRLTKCFGETDDKEFPNEEEISEKRVATSKRSNARKLGFEKKITTLLETKGEDLSPIIACLSAWAIHLCRHGTQYTPVLRANSVSRYIRTIGATLTELAYDKDFLSLSSIVLEDMFRNVVNSTPRKSQTYVLGRLNEFHHFLRSTYGTPQLDWGEVVDEELLEADAIDAGIVTVAEFHRALNIIINSPEAENRTRLARAVLLTLIYRFGIRVGEAFQLTVSDILCDQKQIILYVRNSIHGETKTDHGMRQLPLLGSLSDLEQQLLKQWLAHVQEYAEDPLALLFPEVEDSRHGVDRTVNTAAMTAALRSACGDENVRLRHLRHTCASRLFLAMFYPQCPHGLTGQIYNALWEEHDPAHVRSQLLGGTSISRRGLYAIALYMGHASPSTTLRHYVHSADLVLKDLLDEADVGISDRTLAYCYQANYANLRKIRSRSHLASEADNKDHPLHEQFLRRSGIQEPDFKENEAPQSAPLIEPPSKNLEPATLDRLLSIATMRGSIDGLGDRFLCSDLAIVGALREAVRLQELTGYTDFGLTASNIDDYWVAPDYLRRPTLEKDSSRARRFLTHMSQDPNHIAALSSLAQIWARNYLPHSTPLLVSRKSDLAKFIASWQALGMDIKDFEAILPKAKWGNLFIELNQRKHQLKRMGLQVRNISRLPQRTLPDIPGNRVGLILRASDTHQLGYQATLDRVLFIMALWSELTG